MERFTLQNSEVRPQRAVIELLVITLSALAASWWFSPNDVFLNNSVFPWLVFGPLLIALRYGFAYGLASSILLFSLPFALGSFGLVGAVDFSISGAVGLVTVTLLSGEYRDAWYRKLSQKEYVIRYQRARLNEFTRHYYLLKASHDRIEQQLTSQQNSLRSTLAGFRHQLMSVKADGKPLTTSMQSGLRLICNTCSLQVAAVFQVVDGEVKPKPLAKVGVLDIAVKEDALVRLAIEKKQLVSVRNHDIELVDVHKKSNLLVCAPMTDANGHVHAVLTVQALPFYAFGVDNLRLLTLLCGYLTDVFIEMLQHDDSSVHDDVLSFVAEIRRCLAQKKQHNLDSHVVVIGLHHSLQPQQLLGPIETTKRGLDVSQTITDAQGNTAILLLMPLTDQSGVKGYENRLSLSVYELLGQTVDASAFSVMSHRIEPDEEPVPLLKELINACEILQDINFG